MAVILAISPARENPLPQIEILGHQVVQIGFDASQLVSAPRHDITMLDCRTDLANAKAMARALDMAIAMARARALGMAKANGKDKNFNFAGKHLPCLSTQTLCQIC